MTEGEATKTPDKDKDPEKEKENSEAGTDSVEKPGEKQAIEAKDAKDKLAADSKADPEHNASIKEMEERAKLTAFLKTLSETVIAGAEKYDKANPQKKSTPADKLAESNERIIDGGKTKQTINPGTGEVRNEFAEGPYKSISFTPGDTTPHVEMRDPAEKVPYEAAGLKITTQEIDGKSITVFANGIVQTKFAGNDPEARESRIDFPKGLNTEVSRIIYKQDRTHNPDEKIVARTSIGPAGSLITEINHTHKGVTRLDEKGQITHVDRVDGSKIDVERRADGKIIKITDSKGPTVWESTDKDAKEFTRRDSDPKITVRGEPSVSNNGDYEFKNGKRSFGRTAEGTVTVGDDGRKTVVKDDGSAIVFKKDGTPEKSMSAVGVTLAVKHEQIQSTDKTSANAMQGKVIEAQVGAQIWSRSKESGKEDLWTSNDGQSKRGEFSLEKDGSLHFVDAKTKLELIQKLDGSTIERDEKKNVSRVTTPDGQYTKYESADGRLNKILMPDGTGLTRLPDLKVAGKDPVERWVQDGTNKITEGSKKLDAEGNLIVKDAGQALKVVRADGLEERYENDQKILTKTNWDKSSVGKNELGQIVESKTADGQRKKYSYDKTGNLNGIDLGKEGKWNSADGGKTWTKEAAKDSAKDPVQKNSKEGSKEGTKDGSAPVEQKTAKFLITEKGDLVEQQTRDGKSFEEIRKADGSVLQAVDGRFTSMRPNSSAPNAAEFKVEYGKDGNPNRFQDSSEKGSYWTSTDNMTWTKQKADGTPDASVAAKQFSVGFDSQGNLLRKNGDAATSTIDKFGTDGSSKLLSAEGRKLSEKIPAGNGQFVETKFNYDKENKFLGRETTNPDGLVEKRDSFDRLTEVSKGQDTRKFAYEDSRYPNLVTSFQDHQNQYSIDKASLEKGQVLYKNQDPAKQGDQRQGLFTVGKDGSMSVSAPSGFELTDRLDGSKLVRMESGAILDYRNDGKLNSMRTAAGKLHSFKYEMATDHFGRTGRLSSITYGEGQGGTVEWKTSNGIYWNREGSTEKWRGYTSIDPITGTITDKDVYGNVTETGLDGIPNKRPDKSSAIISSADSINTANGYYWNSSAIEQIRGQLKDKSAEDIQLVKEVFEERWGKSLRGELYKRFDEGSDTHRWEEVKGYLNRSGKPGELSAIQLSVDAQEINRWWWNRDRSKSEILASTATTLGTATEAERQNIDAAQRALYGRTLKDLYSDNGAGATLRTFDKYHEAVIGLAAEKGKDIRTEAEERKILDAALGSNSGDRLDYFMQASGAIVKAETREKFMADGGSSKIREAFTRTVSNGRSGTTSRITDEWQVQQATDFAETGALRPYTAVRKASGVFSNDDKVIEHTLERLTPEQRNQFQDGQRLAESGKTRAELATDKERQSYDFFTKMSDSFKSLHYFGTERKAEKYMDKTREKGGTDIAGKISEIGGHWTNSHQVNAQAIESMDQKTFNTLVTKPEFQKQYLGALEKNLGSGEYIDEAKTLLNNKINEADRLNKAADAGQLNVLRDAIPAFKNLPEAQFNNISAGHALEQKLKSGEIKPDQLSAEQAEQLKAYRGENPVRQFMEGRELATRLQEIGSGARSQRLFAGQKLEQDLAAEGKTPTAEQKKEIDFYKQNAKEIEGLTPALQSQIASRQNEAFLKEVKSMSEGALKSLDAYQTKLYDTVQQSTKRDLLTSLKQNESVWGNDRKAMLDAIVGMNASEREAIKKDFDGKGKELLDQLKTKFGNGTDTDPRYKLAESLLLQIKNSPNTVPDAPKMTATEQLLARAGQIAPYSNKDAVQIVTEALKQDKEGKTALSLAKDAEFKKAAIAALIMDPYASDEAKESSYKQLIKPLLDNGRLSSSTLTDRHTHLVSSGEGDPGTPVLDTKKFFEEGVLDASPQAMKFLTSSEGSAEREKILSELKSNNPQLHKVAEEIFKNNGKIGNEDRVRALLATGDKDKVLDLLRGLPDQGKRAELAKNYETKYGGNVRADVLALVGNKEYSQAFRATRTEDWDAELSHNEKMLEVYKSDAGLGGKLARAYNVTHLEALNEFSNLKFEAGITGVPLTPQKIEEMNRLVESTVKSFQETKASTADTVVVAGITAGSLALAPFTAGTSLYGLTGIAAVMGVTGAGIKYGLMGNDTEGVKELAGDVFKYTALALANQIGPGHLIRASGMGVNVAEAATVNALSSAALKGAVNSEARELVKRGMTKLVQEGLENGGVANKAISEMVTGIKGLDAATQKALAAELQAALPNAVKAEMEGALRQMLQTARQEAKVLAYNAAAGGVGNTVGEAGRQLIDEGRINAENLEVAFAQGTVFAGVLGTTFRATGKGLKHAFGKSDAPHITGDAPPNAHPNSNSGDGSIPVALTNPDTPGTLRPNAEAPNLHTTAGEQGDNVLPFRKPEVEANPRTRVGNDGNLELKAAAALDNTKGAGDGNIASTRYKVDIKAPTDAELAALQKAVPQLSKEVAEDFSRTINKVRESWAEDLTPKVRQADELAANANKASRVHDSNTLRAEQSGASKADIEAARANPEHPLNKDFDLHGSKQSWQAAVNEHKVLNEQINGKVLERANQLQTEINAFTLKNNLPKVDLEVITNVHAGGMYSFGDGLVSLPKDAFTAPGGVANLNNIVYHEISHAVGQDELLVRNAQRIASEQGKAGDAAAIKQIYKEATDRNLSDEWLARVSKNSESRPPLNADEISRANKLSEAVKHSLSDVGSRSEEFGNSARVIESKLNDLKANADGKSVDRLFKALVDEPGGDTLANRLFGNEAPSAELKKAMSDWNQARKSGTAFDSEPARQALLKHLDSEFSSVNKAHKNLIDQYAGNLIEREAYGLAHQVRELPANSALNNTDSVRTQTRPAADSSTGNSTEITAESRARNRQNNFLPPEADVVVPTRTEFQTGDSIAFKGNSTFPEGEIKGDFGRAYTDSVLVMLDDDIARVAPATPPDPKTLVELKGTRFEWAKDPEGNIYSKGANGEYTVFEKDVIAIPRDKIQAIVDRNGLRIDVKPIDELSTKIKANDKLLPREGPVSREHVLANMQSAPILDFSETTLVALNNKRGATAFNPHGGNQNCLDCVAAVARTLKTGEMRSAKDLAMMTRNGTDDGRLIGRNTPVRADDVAEAKAMQLGWFKDAAGVDEAVRTESISGQDILGGKKQLEPNKDYLVTIKVRETDEALFEHAIYARTMDDGKVMYYDPQSGVRWNPDSIMKSNQGFGVDFHPLNPVAKPEYTFRTKNTAASTNSTDVPLNTGTKTASGNVKNEKLTDNSIKSIFGDGGSSYDSRVLSGNRNARVLFGLDAAEMPNAGGDYSKLGKFQIKDNNGNSFDLSGDKSTIGRYPTNDLKFTDDKVSRFHAQIENTPQGPVITNLSGGSHGTRVNGKQITEPTLLKPGDRINLSKDTEIVFGENPLAGEKTLILPRPQAEAKPFLYDGNKVFARMQDPYNPDNVIVHIPEKANYAKLGVSGEGMELKPVDLGGGLTGEPNIHYRDNQGNFYFKIDTRKGPIYYLDHEYESVNLKNLQEVQAKPEIVSPRIPEVKAIAAVEPVRPPVIRDEVPIAPGRDATAPAGRAAFDELPAGYEKVRIVIDGKTVDFDPRQGLNLGREQLNLRDAKISRDHGNIKWDKEHQSFYIEDHSSNGTYIKRPGDADFTKYHDQKVFVGPYDQIRVGQTIIRLDAPELPRSNYSGAMRTTDVQAYFDGKPVRVQNGEIKLGLNHQTFGNESKDILQRLVSREHASLKFDDQSGMWIIRDTTKTAKPVDIYNTIAAKAGEGNGTYVVHNDGTHTVLRGDNAGKESLALKAGDRVHLGSLDGPELKLIFGKGKDLGDGRMEYTRPNMDRVLRRPDGSQQIFTFAGTHRVEDINGQIVQTIDRQGFKTRLDYENNQLAKVTFHDGSTVSKEGNVWMRTALDGKKEQWWKGKMDVDPTDGSLKYTDTGKPPRVTIEKLDGTRQIDPGNGRIEYKNVRLSDEVQHMNRLWQNTDVFKTQAERVRFKDLMNSFEKRAKDSKLTPEQAALTFHHVRRLLEAGDGSMVPAELRKDLAEQILNQAARPRLISQGTNNTCNVTTLERRIFTRNPDEAARLIADAATTGKYVAADGRIVDLTRVPGALTPDAQSSQLLARQFMSGNADLAVDGMRTYASQVFETAAVNVKYAQAGTNPEVVLYRKRPGLPGQEREELIKFSRNWIDGALDQQVIGDAPSINTEDLAGVHNQIVGKNEANFVIRGPESFTTPGYMKYADNFGDKMRVPQTVKEFKDLLTATKPGDFPIVLQVHTGHPFFGQSGQGGAHVINITGIRETAPGSGKYILDFANQWGEKYNGSMKLEDAYGLMFNPKTNPVPRHAFMPGKPPENPPPSLDPVLAERDIRRRIN